MHLIQKILTSEECRQACTVNSLCIAYSYGPDLCYLIQSYDICEDDHELIKMNNYTLAKTYSDIIAMEYDGVECYTKILGNNLVSYR